MWLALLLSLSMAQAAVTGVVRDTSGGAISGATVTIRDGSGDEQQTVTGPNGRFEIARPAGATTLVVRAGGFAEVRQTLGAASDVEIVLPPAGLLETITVTPGRTEQQLGRVPASVTVLDAEEIRQSPALVADDVLRQVPTFSLFRRTSSLASHPTAQGVSLRGIGPSGVSRTLVLIDSIPFNDPFGGWVYWTRVPLESVDRIEVVDGPSSNVYGNYAMGGVINIVSSRPTARTLELKAQYGNRNSPKFDFFGSDVFGKVGVALEGSFFDTEGFPVVVDSERGPVDTKFAVTYRNVNAKIDYAPTSRVSTFFRAGYFREERDNGKVSTFTGAPEANDTTWRHLGGGIRASLPGQGDLQARLFGDFETFHSTFLAVPNLVTRAIGRTSLDQNVPSKNFGGMVQWSRAFGTRNVVTAGTDWRWVDGDSEETVLDAQQGINPTTFRVSGGTQRSLGFFVQDVITPADNVSVTLSARVDSWKNYEGHNLETSAATGLPTANHRPELPDRDDTVVTPRVAVMYRLNDQASVWGGLSRGFRAPTLNELYRQFRVGAVATFANEDLGPERLLGGELGLNLAPSRDVTLRTTWYDNRVRDAVTNVTIRTNTRQRQNVGLTRIWGWQSDVDYRPLPAWRFSAGYLFNQAKVREFEQNPGLVGNFLAQVPRHRGSVQAVYSDPRLFTFAIGVQVIGRQFDDDENLSTVPGEAEPGLPGYAVVDITASRTLHRNLDVFVGAQNLFDQEYFVGTNPTTIGSPVLVHGGVRVRVTGW